MNRNVKTVSILCFITLSSLPFCCSREVATLDDTGGDKGASDVIWDSSAVDGERADDNTVADENQADSGFDTGPDAGVSQKIAQSVSTGALHSCVVTTEGGVYCWGDNEQGQLGNGGRNNSELPVHVQGLDKGVVSVSCGTYHTCALTESGNIQCWGFNAGGEVGDGTKISRLTPVDVVGLGGGAEAVFSLNVHTCAIMKTGNVKCWGANADGQLGNDNKIDSPVPVDVTAVTGRTLSLTMSEPVTCALLADNTVSCWGTPPHIYNEEPYFAISKGLSSLMCFILNSGGLKCEGGLFNGDGTKQNSYKPVSVVAMEKDVVKVAAGGKHGCALIKSGEVWCWGDNYYYQIRQSESDLEYLMPIIVISAELSGPVVDIAAGELHTCAVFDNGEVTCWGNNAWGQVGVRGELLYRPWVELREGFGERTVGKGC